VAWQDYAENIVLMERKIIDDGMGGYEENWAEGITFKGSVRTSNSLQTLIAEQQGVTSVYMLLFPIDLPLKYGDVLKQGERYFKITSNPEDGKPPKTSPIDFISVTLENYIMV
jgi:hypothetical protein